MRSVILGVLVPEDSNGSPPTPALPVSDQTLEGCDVFEGFDTLKFTACCVLPIFSAIVIIMCSECTSPLYHRRLGAANEIKIPTTHVIFWITLFYFSIVLSSGLNFKSKKRTVLIKVRQVKDNS